MCLFCRCVPGVGVFLLWVYALSWCVYVVDVSLVLVCFCFSYIPGLGVFLGRMCPWCGYVFGVGVSLMWVSILCNENPV